jgi:hypothetical protein
MRIAALFVAVAAGLPPASHAAIYTCTDSQGRTVFRDAPCARGERVTEARTGRRSSIDGAAREPPATLDRSRVQRVLARLDRAMTRRDAQGVMALLADDAKVRWVAADRKAGRALDRDAYAAYLRRLFARPDYVYQRKDARIALSKRGPKATVTRTLREGVMLDGRLEVAEVRERLTIEPEGRKLVIRSLRKSARPESG